MGHSFAQNAQIEDHNMTSLPLVLGISPGDHGCGQTLTWLVQGAVVGGLKAIILREPHLSRPAYVELARRISPLFGTGLILDASHDDAYDIAAASGWGLHLPSADGIKSMRAALSGTIGVSCHNKDDLAAAAEAGADYATISPVFPPLSKGAKAHDALDVSGLIDAIRDVDMPIFARGGITDQTARAVADTNIHGVASLSFLFPNDADADVCEANATTLSMIMKRHR
jgi:thiamine-phosphate pyrophosphorylase